MDIPSMLWLPNWVLYTAVVLLLLYYLGTWNHDHFKKRSIPFIKPYPFLGSLGGGSFFFRESLSGMISNLYNNIKGERCVGLFSLTTPTIIIRDPDLIRVIGVKEFDHFMNHQQTVHEDSEPLFAKNLFALKDKRWRDMRATLSPAFTSSKMKAMFMLMLECGQQLADHLEIKIKEKAAVSKQILAIELKDFCTRFTNDVIATTAFGVKCDSLKEPENEFYKMGIETSEFSANRQLLWLVFALFPKLITALKIPLFVSTKASRFFRSLVHDTITTREREGIIRPDMIHLLMQARKGELKAEAEEDEFNSGVQGGSKTKLGEDDITAQAVIFFLAGFDNSSSLICFCAYELALNPDIQKRLQEEIDMFTDENESNFTYEAIQKMKYLDMVLSETLRLYPPAIFTDRVCVKSLTIPRTEQHPPLRLEKGDSLWLPIFPMHRDPEYFPDPENFDPDRFSDENKHRIKPFSYMPFGVGPRICIAQRFALLEAKVALVCLLSRFNLHVVRNTPIPMKFSKKKFNLMPEEGFWTGFTPRAKNNFQS